MSTHGEVEPMSLRVTKSKRLAEEATLSMIVQMSATRPWWGRKAWVMRLRGGKSTARVTMLVRGEQLEFPELPTEFLEKSEMLTRPLTRRIDHGALIASGGAAGTRLINAVEMTHGLASQRSASTTSSCQRPTRRRPTIPSW